MANFAADIPEYPITVRWTATEAETFENAIDIESKLDGFDSESPSGSIGVVDNLGRPVVLKVDAVSIVRLELK